MHWRVHEKKTVLRQATRVVKNGATWDRFESKTKILRKQNFKKF